MDYEEKGPGRMHAAQALMELMDKMEMEGRGPKKAIMVEVKKDHEDEEEDLSPEMIEKLREKLKGLG